MERVTTATSAATTAHEHLKNVALIHSSWHAAGAAALVNLLNIGTLVVHLTLLLVKQHTVSFVDVLELRLCLLLLLFTAVGMLIRVPLKRTFPVRLLNY